MKELKITVDRIIDHCGAMHTKGDCFYVRGQGKIQIPKDKDFCMYAIQSMIPFLITKQQEDDLPKSDWVTQTNELCCPDLNGVVFKIEEAK